MKKKLMTMLISIIVFSSALEIEREILRAAVKVGLQ
jgi:hypothetical protein